MRPKASPCGRYVALLCPGEATMGSPFGLSTWVEKCQIWRAPARSRRLFREASSVEWTPASRILHITIALQVASRGARANARPHHPSEHQTWSSMQQSC